MNVYEINMDARIYPAPLWAMLVPNRQIQSEPVTNNGAG